MAQSTIQAGICGFRTTVRAAAGEDGMTCTLEVVSDCPHVAALGGALPSVNAYEEISFAGGMPSVLRLASEHLPHPACPVPAGMLKAVEVAAGLALPGNAVIEVAD